MPNTLAALPKSQYATTLSLILGKPVLAFAALSSKVPSVAGEAADRLMLEVKK